MSDRTKKSDPDPEPPLPIKLARVSNGEFDPPPPSRTTLLAERMARERSAEAARRLGMSRRDFLRSSCGAATVLLALNEATGCAGGRYRVPSEAVYEEAAAAEVLAGDELIFDVQTHHVDPERDWPGRNLPVQLLAFAAPYKLCGEPRWMSCYSREHYVRELFLDSDTDMAVLSVLPGVGEASSLLIDEMAATQEVVDRLEGSKRLLLHGFVPPPFARAELHERMAELAEVWKVSAFKLYPIGGPDRDGYWLDDPERGVPIFEEARRVGVPIVAVHKGLPLPFTDAEYARCRDVGNIARMFPDVKLLIYHSGYELFRREGPYDPGADRGVDRFIRDLREAGIGPGDNVWADLGSTWRQLMDNPDQAAHVLGKLLVQLGEDRVLWGTDSIWYGSPQDQIQAFRAFEISPEYQERYGYPALTPEIKEKILGRNAAAVYGIDPDAARVALRDDAIARAKAQYEPRPSFATYGPCTRRELLALYRRHHGPQ